MWSTLSEIVHNMGPLSTEQLKSVSESVQCIFQDVYKQRVNTDSRSDSSQENARKELIDLKRNTSSDLERLVLYTKQDDGQNSQTGDKCIHRRDSGISVSSPENMPDSTFRRRSLGRGSFGGREPYRLAQKPQRRVRPVIWETIQIREAQSELANVW